MTDNSKITRIFLELQKAKDKGILETDLLGDWEKSGNTRTIKHRVIINKMLGHDSVTVVSGRWYLSSEHWNMTLLEFKDTLHRWDMIHLHHGNQKVILGIVGIFAVLLVGIGFTSYNVGRPDTIYQCGEIFNTPLNLDTDGT